jgi:hypothetical protein
MYTSTTSGLSKRGYSTVSQSMDIRRAFAEVQSLRAMRQLRTTVPVKSVTIGVDPDGRPIPVIHWGVK